MTVVDAFLVCEVSEVCVFVLDERFGGEVCHAALVGVSFVGLREGVACGITVAFDEFGGSGLGGVE